MLVPLLPSTCQILMVSFYSNNIIDISLAYIGDGWNANYLYIGDYSITLGFGNSATSDVCLEDGAYSPYCCGGNYAGEVMWTIPAYGISGGAISSCSAALLSDTWKTFMVDAAAPTKSPTRAPTLTPTLTETPTLTKTPTLTETPTLLLYSKKSNGDESSSSSSIGIGLGIAIPVLCVILVKFCYGKKREGEDGKQKNTEMAPPPQAQNGNSWSNRLYGSSTVVPEYEYGDSSAPRQQTQLDEWWKDYRAEQDQWSREYKKGNEEFWKQYVIPAT
jgi:hypothetical protein